MNAPAALPRHELAGILVTVGAAVIYGFYPAATRGLYAEGGNAIFLTMLSLFARALVLVVYCLATQKKLFSSREHIKAGVINGAYQFMSIGCILWAMTYLPGPVVVTIMFSYATMLYLYMVIRGEEPYSMSTLGTVIAAFAGVAMVMNVFHTDGLTSIKGAAIAFVSAVVVAARIYKFGAAFKTLNPAVVGAETFICAFAFSCILPFFGPVLLPHTDMGWGWATLSSASLALGGFAALYGIALLGPFKFAFFIKLEPVFGAILSAVLIHEILGVTQYAGIALVVGSLLAYQLMQKKGTA